MNIKLLCKKTYKSLLALMIMFSMFPQFTETVVAEETTIPVEQFATVEELKTFNTNDNDGEVKAAKVYFGNYDQQWWIAGSQNENLTLFAATPLATYQQFEPNETQNKQYSADWKCDYASTGVSYPSEVYPNHYGASTLRTELKNLETSYFTSAEQYLMNDTTIYTNDSKNNSVYSTTDKLYLAYGDTSVKEYITVGTNDQNNLNNGLRVDKNYYWCGWFWLREPNIKHSQTALGVGSDGSMYGLSVDDNNDLVPAFELNISSVEFASAVSVASSDGQLQIGDAFTLRYNSKDDIGTATISQSRRSLAVTDIKNENTYLVVQNATGAWSKKVNNNDVVFASELNDALTSFENCKVWIETTKDRITYGKLASDGQGRNIKVIPQEGITVVNKTQVGVTNSITDITVKAADGHYLPSNYVDEVKKLALNGLTVSKTEDGIKISGTPTNDVNVVLPEARRDQFVVEGGTKGVDYTYQNGVLTFINNGSYVLKHPSGITDTSDRVVIANNFNGSLTLDNISINLNGVPCIDVTSDANLTLIIKGKNKLGVHDGDPAAIQFMNVAENGSLTIDSEEPVGELNLHGRNGPGLGSLGYNSAYTKNIYINGGIIDASSDNGIGIGSYSDSNASEITINGGTIKGGKIGSNYKGSKVIINGGYIQNSINVETEINGGFVKGNIEDNEIKNSNGDVVYKTNIALESDYVKSLKVDDIVYNFPTQPGGKDISVYLPQGEHTVTHEDNDGKAYEYKVIINKDGTVKNVNTWAEKLSIKGWKYGETANTPTAKAKFGSVTYTYSDKENGTYTSDVPSNAGTYYVKATVTETENYTGLESVVPFEIKKADSNVTITTKSLDKTYDGNKVNDPTYETSGSDGKVSIKYQEYKADKWVDLSSAPTNVGKYKVVVTLDGNDNFNSASKELEFTISKTTVNTWAEKLSIKGWKYGETANTPTAKAKFGSVTYTYSDKENGTYTSDVPSNAGTYYVKATVTETENYTGLESVVPFEIKKADSNVTITTKSLDKTYDGNKVNDPTYETSGSDGKVSIKYQEYKADKWVDLSSAPTNVGKYKVVVTLDGNDNFNSASKELEFTISKTTVNTWAEKLSIKGWKYGETANTPTAKAKFGSVTYTYSDKENGTYTSDVPSNAGTYYVKATVTETENYTGLESVVPFEIKKADSNVTITTKSLDKTYDGNKVNDPTYETSGSDGKVSIKYQEYKADKWVDLSSAPTNVGKYKVVVTLDGNDNFNSASKELEFTISKTTVNTWAEKLSIKGWKYGETANTPTAKAKFGSVTYTYSDKENGTYTSDVPSNAGTYYVKATVTETENYTGLESVVPFEIKKADSNVTITTKSLDKTYDGNKVNDPTYETSGSDGKVSIKYQEYKADKWVDLSSAPTNVGKYKVVVTLDGNDNFNSASKELEFTISKTTVNTWAEKLSIKGWKYGETANTPTAKAKFGSVTYTYSDKENGTYTSDVPSNAGTYYVKATVTETENYTGLESVVPFEIKKADSNVTITTKSLDKTYDGNKVNDPTYETSGSDGKVSIKYQEYKADKWVDLSSAPTNVGKYKVVVTLDGNDNFNSASKELEFTISKTTVNTWAEKLSIKGWKYGETANTPTAKAKFGSVTYTYSDKENGTYTSDVPSNAGTYYVKATVTETENYTGLESVVPFEIKKADSNVTITTKSLDKTYDGNKVNDPTYETSGSDGKVSIKYQEYKADKWVDLSSAPTNVGKYKVVVTLDGNDNFNSASKELEFTISKTTVNTWAEKLSIKGWKYGETANTPTAKAKFGSVTYTYSDKENGTYTSDVPSNAGTYYVKATVTETENYTGLESVVPFEIKKADSNVTITTKSLDKTYDGNKVNDPTYETSGSDGKVSIKYQEYKADKWVDLSSAPTNVGKYKVVVTLDGNDNFNSASKELEFTISKTTVNTWAEKLSIKGWKYGETANTPTAKAKFGSVTYTYSDKENGTYTSDVPSNAGTYYVKATVTETENYTGLESVVPFEILKADPVLKALDTLTIEEGKTLKSLGLPEGYKWKNPDYECKDLGTYTYKAVYTPKDSVNYNVLDVEVSVKVIAKSVETSPVVTPSITNNNNNTNHTYNGNGTSSTSSSLKELSEVVSKSEYKAYEKAYTKDSYDNYLNAFENAGKVLNNKNSSKEEIKVALDKLNEAILNLKVDKTNLESSLVEFEKLDADKYSEASYIKLKDTLDKAKSVMEDKEASPEEIANAIEELNNAYSSLQSAEPKVETPKKSSVGKVALITTVTTVVVAGGGSYLWILLKRSRGMK